MDNIFRIEQIETAKGVTITPKGFIKVFTNTNDYLPLGIDVENRFGIFSRESEKYLEQLHNFEVRKDDVWVITTMKSGTTWMCEMVWMLVNNFDYDRAMEIEQAERCRYIEYVALNPSVDSIEIAANMKSPRVLKSHLPMHMLPKGLWTVKPKIVYVTRDPKDRLVSYYHFVTGLGINSVSVENFVNETVEDRTIYSPFWSHVAEFWSIRNEPYVYFTSFERMKHDLRFEILKVSNLLGKTVSKEQLDKLVEHLTFDKMKNNESCNSVKHVRRVQKLHGVEEKPLGVYVRKGKVGSYREEISNDLIKKLEDWTERSIKPYGISPEEILFP